MAIFFSFFFFIFGTIVASFIGVVAGRLYTGESIVHGRSRCDACGRPLGILDLVPIISHLAFSGRARCCRARISAFSSLHEVLLGVLYSIAFSTSGLTPSFVVLLVALALLDLLVMYDLIHMILPKEPLALFVVVSAGYAWMVAPSLTALALSAALAGLVGGCLAVIHLVSGGRAMGLADAPLAFGLALLTGPMALAGFAYSFWLGAVIGLVLLSLRPSGHRMGVEVPFAPYLAAGFLLALFTPWDPFLIISNFIGGLL